MTTPITREQLEKVLAWISAGNDDGQPDEVRACYSDVEWVGIMSAYLETKDIPTSSSHMYQCEACCSRLERFMDRHDLVTGNTG
jgi:hypothetical protein